MSSPSIDTSGMPKTPSDLLGEVKGPLIPPTKPDIQKPAETSLLEILKTPGMRLWTMYYRTGVSKENFRCFPFAGDQRGATQRAKEHCEKMGFSHKYTVPFLCDLNYSEALREQALSRGDNGQGMY